MGLEGLVSKRADRRYRAGRSKDWTKVKNRKHPAVSRVKDLLGQLRGADRRSDGGSVLRALPDREEASIRAHDELDRLAAGLASAPVRQRPSHLLAS